MRWLLVLALVVHFSGVPAAGRAMCAPARAAQHTCCHQASGQAGESMGGHCGCAMAPGSPAEGRAPVGVVPDGRDLAVAAAPVLSAGPAVAAPALDLLAPRADHAPPGADSFLSGAGFRC